ncbi:MAG TPA: TetR/AcrR family transcriptional regulator [Rhabdaerophilum sp.]|nr:TetR/AcrR family transcriptional regulator [Rhabdaerophilum sp.]
MARKAENAPKPVTDPRTRVVDALMALAAEMHWGDITLNDIAAKADVPLADLRDLFPSKGAMLGGFIRRIDRQMLEHPATDLAAEPAHDRVLDLMIRRFDTLKPYRAALRNIHRVFQGDLTGLAALNSQALNSWRYLLASADIDTEGPLGYLRLQGAILVFVRVFPIFLDDAGEELPRTMAALDRELKRGEWVLRRAEGVHRLMAPFQGFCRAARENRREARPPGPASDAA